jgi:uncharacterized protein (DUF2267 family)
MEYGRFIGLVQDRARLETTNHAVVAIRATFETLAERIGKNEARHLAAQLPHEIAHYLRESPPEVGERFSFEEFCQRIAKRENGEVADAVFHARCVFETVEEAVTEGEVSHVVGMLPEDFGPLFSAGHEGKMPGHH